ncbi:hypothetical protein PIROE2DRAFT_9906 [Piromyces sp. E2]|nr:hypothetical protein PIROE2DRAFT_9906 [Piromyces sp. E2]|eukprot:OUM63491.1 hypothetical protein PIROE2DRAFT_9906 [Piromyces sp. E2]
MTSISTFLPFNDFITNCDTLYYKQRASYPPPIPDSQGFPKQFPLERDKKIQKVPVKYSLDKSLYILPTTEGLNIVTIQS